MPVAPTCTWPDLSYEWAGVHVSNATSVNRECRFADPARATALEPPFIRKWLDHISLIERGESRLTFGIRIDPNQWAAVHCAARRANKDQER